MGRFQFHDMKITNISNNIKTKNIIKLPQPRVKKKYRAVTMNIKIRLKKEIALVFRSQEELLLSKMR